MFPQSFIFVEFIFNTGHIFRLPWTNLLRGRCFLPLSNLLLLYDGKRIGWKKNPGLLMTYFFILSHPLSSVFFIPSLCPAPRKTNFLAQSSYPYIYTFYPSFVVNYMAMFFSIFSLFSDGILLLFLSSW